MIDNIHSLRKGVCSLALTLILILLTTRISTASQIFQTATDGEAIFKDKCSRCHTIGGGTKRGPDLKGVTQLRDKQWMIDFISNPRQVIASGDTIANSLLEQFNNTVMPDVGLSEEQVFTVISYLDEKSRPAATAAPEAGGVQQPLDANPDNGRLLFTGDVKLENEGPACISCHRINDVGILGGGMVGPDLTEASGIFGEAGLASALGDIPFITMQPIFSDHPLTENERADLAAFITSQSGKVPVNKELLLLGLSLAGFVGAMMLGAFYWRKRLKGVRKQLVEQSYMRRQRKLRRVP